MKISTAFSTPAFPSFISSSRRRTTRRTTKSASFDDDAKNDEDYYNLDELFDDDRPSNRKTLFDMSKKAQKKTNPILLLDDIFDKLDAQRVQKLVALVTQDYFGQVMVSDTDEDRMKALLKSLKGPSKLFEVTEGDVNEISS